MCIETYTRDQTFLECNHPYIFCRHSQESTDSCRPLGDKVRSRDENTPDRRGHNLDRKTHPDMAKIKTKEKSK